MINLYYNFLFIFLAWLACYSFVFCLCLFCLFRCLTLTLDIYRNINYSNILCFWNINNYTLFCISWGENSVVCCCFLYWFTDVFLRKSVSLTDYLSFFDNDWLDCDPPTFLLLDLYVKYFLLWLFSVVTIVCDNVWNLLLKTLYWNIFFW